MITYLYGKIMEILEDSIWLNVQNVGYEIAIYPKQLPQLVPNTERGIYCHMLVSDSEVKLYGFLSREELLLFRRLMTVSGVGGKAAQTMVANMQTSTLIHAIIAGDEKTLTQLPGVGKKMASRLVFELREKLSAGAAGMAVLSVPKQEEAASQMLSEVMEAMEALGYSRSEIYPLLVQLQETQQLQSRIEDNIKVLLRMLSEKKRR